MSEQTKITTAADATTMQRDTTDRRDFLRQSGGLTLSASALTLLAGCQTVGDLFGSSDSSRSSAQPARTAQAQTASPAVEESDVRLLNTALALEHEAIAAYQLAVESRAVQRPFVPVLQLFQSHHREHRDSLAAAIRQFGGNAVGERPREEYANALGLGNARDQAAIFRAAWRLERGAANAYIGVVSSFQDRRLAQAAARLAADESMHWTALAGLLREQLPGAALSFGG
jgi:rubrerythrin